MRRQARLARDGHHGHGPHRGGLPDAARWSSCGARLAGRQRRRAAGRRAADLDDRRAATARLSLALQGAWTVMAEVEGQGGDAARRRDVHGRPALALARALELGGAASRPLVAAVAALGRGAERFAGVGLWANLLPFAAVAVVFGLGLAVAAARLARGSAPGSSRARRPAPARRRDSPSRLAASWWATQPRVSARPACVCGRPSAEPPRPSAWRSPTRSSPRTAVADRQALARMLERARRTSPSVHEAAAAFGIDPEVLDGRRRGRIVASSRAASADGGRGLFRSRHRPRTPSRPCAAGSASPRPTRTIPGRTPGSPPQRWRATSRDMDGDLFLGLLAYNIGPHKRRPPLDHGPVRRARFRHHPALPPAAPARLSGTRAVRRRSPIGSGRAEAALPAYEVGDNAAAHPAPRRPGPADAGGTPMQILSCPDKSYLCRIACGRSTFRTGGSPMTTSLLDAPACWRCCW